MPRAVAKGIHFHPLRHRSTAFARCHPLKQPMRFSVIAAFGTHHFLRVRPRIGWAVANPPVSHRSLLRPRLEFSGAASFAFFFSAKGAGFDVTLVNFCPPCTSYPVVVLWDFRRGRPDVHRLQVLES